MNRVCFLYLDFLLPFFVSLTETIFMLRMIKVACVLASFHRSFRPMPPIPFWEHESAGHESADRMQGKVFFHLLSKELQSLSQLNILTDV